MKKILVSLVIMLVLLMGYENTVYAADVGDEHASVAQDKADEALSDLKDKNSALGQRYDELMDDIANGNIGNGKASGDFLRDLVEGYYRFYQAYKASVPYLSLASVFIGVVVAFIGQNDNQIKRNAILWGIFLIPILLITVVFLLGWCNSMVF